MKYKVKSIKKELAYEWFKYKHYSKRIPMILYCFGLYENDIIVGVCSFGLPASPDLCKTFGEENIKNFIELNRHIINDDLDKNASSFFISKCLKLLPSPMIVFSFADDEQGHKGYIYQATNWIYTGLTKKQKDKRIKGTNKHPRHAYDYNDIETELIERTQKHRYFYLIGTKKQKKDFIKKMNFDIMPYPKGDNKKYDASYKTQIQTELFV